MVDAWNASNAELEQIKDQFAMGTYERPPAFDEFFEHVDGFRDPIRLVFEGHAEILERERIQLDDGFLKVAYRFNRKLLAKALTRADQWVDVRTLDAANAVSENWNYSYIFYLRDGGVTKMLENHADSISASTVSVLDLGAGVGLAFSDLLEKDVVCTRRSVALTLPTRQVPECDHSNFLFGNLVFTAPRENVQFDAVMSAYGGIQYHPLCFNDDERGSRFGILHALQFMKVGGLLFQAACWQDEKSYDVLVKTGVLEKVRPYDLAMGSLYHSKEVAEGIRTFGGVYRLLRRPSYKEILDYLFGGGGVSNVISMKYLGLPNRLHGF
jgi:hypothetical protein